MKKMNKDLEKVFKTHGLVLHIVKDTQEIIS